MRSKFLVGVLLLAGCSFQGEKPGGAAKQAEPFLVDPITVEGAVVTSPRGDWSYLGQKSFPLKVCLKDVGTLQPLSGQEFLVGETRAVTDARGCLGVSTPLRHNGLVPETFVPTALKVRQGNAEQALIVGMNPWTGQVLDPRFAALPSPSSRRIPDPIQGVFSNLLVREFSLEPGVPSSRGGSPTLPVSLRLSLSYRYPGLDGNLRGVPLEKGLLRMSLSLFEGDELLGAAKGVEAQVIHGELQVPAVAVKFSRTPSLQGNLAWRMRLEPVGDSEGLLPWEGEVAIAGANLLRSPRGGIVERAPTKSWTTAQPAGGISAFYIDQRVVRYARNLSVDSRRYEAVAGAQIEVCLKDSLTRLPLAGHPFVVDLSLTPELGASAERATTDEAGCLRPTKTFPVSFSYFDAENYLQRYLVVRSETEPYLGEQQTAAVSLNPWHKEDDLFFWDGRRGAAPVNPAPQRASLQLSEVRYEYPPQQDDLELDNRLNLTYKDVYYVGVKPVVNRPFSFAKGQGPTRSQEELWPGFRFKVRILFAATRLPSLPSKEPYNHLRLLSTYETVATVDQRGMLLFPVALAYQFNERPLLETLVRSIIEISPLDGAGPEPLTVESPFEALADGAGSHNLPVNLGLSFDSLVDKLLPKEMVARKLTLSPEKIGSLSVKPESYVLSKPADREVSSPEELFLRHMTLPKDLVKVDLAPRRLPEELSGFVGMGDVDFLFRAKAETFAAQSQAVAKRLCDYYFVPSDLKSPTAAQRKKPPTPNELCRKAPEQFLRLHRFRFVDEVTSTPLKRPMNLTTLQVSAGFFQEQLDQVTDETGHNSSHNVDAGVTGKVGFEKFGNGVTAHVSYLYKNSWFHTRERSLTNSERNQVRVEEIRALVAEETQVAANAKIRDCLFFRIRPWMGVNGLTEAGRAQRAYFLCRSGETRLEESWYYVSNMASGGSSLMRRDNRDLRNRTWLLLMRGRSTYAALKSELGDRTRQVNLERSNALKDGVDHLINDIFQSPEQPFGFFKDGGVFPGVVDHAGL